MLDDDIEFVKKRIRYHKGRAKRKSTPSEFAAKHLESAKCHERILERLLQLAKNPPAPAGRSDQSPNSGQAESPQLDLFSLNPLEIGDLPQSMQEELNFTDAEILEAQIVELFKLAKKPLTINEVFVALYRQFKVAQQRSPLASRMYRMTQNGVLEALEGKKGVYQLADAAALGVALTEPDESETTNDQKEAAS